MTIYSSNNEFFTYLSIYSCILVVLYLYVSRRSLGLVSSSHITLYTLLPRKGQANFSRLSDAIAEFIDNALSACSMNPGSRDISVSFFLGSSNDTNEITIRDNGQGVSRVWVLIFQTIRMKWQQLTPLFYDAMFKKDDSEWDPFICNVFPYTGRERSST